MQPDDLKKLCFVIITSCKTILSEDGSFSDQETEKEEDKTDEPAWPWP